MIKVLVYGISGNIGGIEKLIYNVITNTPAENISFMTVQLTKQNMKKQVQEFTKSHQNEKTILKTKKGLLNFLINMLRNLLLYGVIQQN